MVVRFVTRKKRLELYNRLIDLVELMQQSHQGQRGPMTPTEEMIGDVRAAAYVVLGAEIPDPWKPFAETGWWLE